MIELTTFLGILQIIQKILQINGAESLCANSYFILVFGIILLQTRSSRRR